MTICNSIQINVKTLTISGIRILTIFSLISFLSTLRFKSWIFEILTNCQGYFFVFHILAILILPFLRREFKKYFKLFYLLQLLIIFKIGLALWPFYIWDRSGSEDGRFQKQNEKLADESKIKLLYANIQFGNNQADKFQSILSALKPDVVVVIEANKEWCEKIGLQKQYSYSAEILRDDSFGLAVYSRYEILNEIISEFGGDTPPALLLKLKLDTDEIMNLAALHTIPPMNNEVMLTNNLLLRRLSSKIRFAEGPLIIAGDFNATPFSRHYKNFLEWLSLKDAFYGMGLKSTWNAKSVLFRFAIDHVLYRDINLSSAEVLGDIGSDHFPILAEFTKSTTKK